MEYLKLVGGTVHDPANGIDGQVRDVWIRDGRIAEPPSDPETAVIVTVDVSGRVVMPGGVDMHCHIAGPKVNSARKLRPEEARGRNHRFRPDDLLSSVPDLMTTGMRYAGLGYTTCFDAAVTPLASRHVHHDFDEVPNVDTGFFALVGNNHYALRAIADGDCGRLKRFLAWLLQRCGAYAPKLVNPGGVELWKQRAGGNASDLDQVIDGFDVTPRQILTAITSAANELGLPHPVHIHCNNLGIPGNVDTTLETMRAIADRRAHLTHIQFHSYAGGGDQDRDLRSGVGPLVDWLNANPNLSVDVGQVMFGETTSLTGDGPLGYFLHRINGGRWLSVDTELESGCGISPIRYRDRNFVHALQWSIGMEWFLRTENPWQISLSSDHPNGASFIAYPRIIRSLMDVEYRREQLQRIAPRALERSELPDIDRSYSLNEIAIITRAAPARQLGLVRKGHLGPGADADITIYTPDENFETMFSWPWGVVKQGQFIIRDGEFVAQTSGRTWVAQCDRDFDHDAAIESWFDRHYSLSARNYGVQPTDEAWLERMVVANDAGAEDVESGGPNDDLR